MALPSDSTLADVYPHLQGNKAERDQLVAKLLFAMKKAGRQHGPVAMRVGITGNGSRPSFRLDRVGAPPLALDANFNEFTDAELSESAWSSSSWSAEDVTAFLTKIRNVRSSANG